MKKVSKQGREDAVSSIVISDVNNFDGVIQPKTTEFPPVNEATEAAVVKDKKSLDFLMPPLFTIFADSVGGVGSGATTIIDNSGVNIWHALSGDDTVWAGASNDIVYGEAGDDILFGEGGDDKLFGGLGNDTIYGGIGNDTIVASTGQSIGDNSGNYLYGDAGDDIIISGNGYNYIEAGDDNDTIALLASIYNQVYCGSGNDIVYGSSGSDQLYGGDGSDKLYGGDGNDTIQAMNGTSEFLSGGNGDDQLFGSMDGGTSKLYGGNGNDKLYGTGELWAVLYGEEGNDQLSQGGFMYGGNGDDSFIAHLTDSTITGGTGADTFVFYHNEFEHTQVAITDFNKQDDIMKLTFGATFSELTLSYVGADTHINYYNTEWTVNGVFLDNSDFI